MTVRKASVTKLLTHTVYLGLDPTLSGVALIGKILVVDSVRGAVEGASLIGDLVTHGVWKSCQYISQNERYAVEDPST
jgi:predicted aconitase with swiveling domain